MDETPRQRAAFLYYATMPKRNLRQLAREFKIGMGTVSVWSRELDWQERVKDFDYATAEQLQHIVMGDWIETRAYLLRVLMSQVIDGVKAGIQPKTTTEMVAAIREIRSMMGDEMPDEANKRVEIVYSRIKDGEKGTGHEDI